MPDQNLEIKFSPWNKLVLWNEIKKQIVSALQNKSITPERSTEIRQFVQSNIKQIDTPEHAKEFYEYLGQEYPELEKLRIKLEIKEEEAIGNALDQIATQLLEQGEFDKSGEIMQAIEDLEKQGLESSDVFLQMQEKYPDLFQIG